MNFKIIIIINNLSLVLPKNNNKMYNKDQLLVIIIIMNKLKIQIKFWAKIKVSYNNPLNKIFKINIKGQFLKCLLSRTKIIPYKIFTSKINKHNNNKVKKE